VLNFFDVAEMLLEVVIGVHLVVVEVDELSGWTFAYGSGGTVHVAAGLDFDWIFDRHRSWWAVHF
jgi:hypothetical protein